MRFVLHSPTKRVKNDLPINGLTGFTLAIYSGRNIPKFLYPAYMKTYLDKDVRDLLQIKDMMQFHTFIRLLRRTYRIAVQSL